MSIRNDQDIQSILQSTDSWREIPERYDEGVGFEYNEGNQVEIVVKEQTDDLEGDYVIGIRPRFEDIDLDNPTGLDEIALNIFRETLNQGLAEGDADSRMRPVNFPGKMRFYGYDREAQKVVDSLNTLAEELSDYDDEQELLSINPAA